MCSGRCRLLVAVRVVSLAAASATGLAAALALPAQAQPLGDAALIWRAPDSCPDAGDVRARIERRLGGPIDRVVHGVAVDVAVHGDGGPRFVARVDLRGASRPSGPSERGRGDATGAPPDEIRVLSSERCDELADAVAVVIVRIAAAAGEPAAEAPRTARAAPALAAPRAWGAGLRALGVSGIGALPGVSIGGELAGYVRVHWLVAELVGMTWLPGSDFLHSDAPARVDVSLRLAALRIGWGPEDLPLRAWLSGELGSLRGEGVGLDDPRAGAGRWLAAGGGFAVAWPVFPHARLVGLIELAVPVQRARFVLQDGSEIYHTGPVTVRSGLGVEVGWR